MNIKVMRRAAIMGLAVGTFISACWMGTMVVKTDRAVYRNTCGLVDKCVAKAAGEDYKLRTEEAVDLARGLGFSGPIYTDEKIALEKPAPCGYTARLCIGWTGTGQPCRAELTITRQDMKDYLNNKSPIN